MDVCTKVGQVGTYSITQEQVKEYANITGDMNPKHFGVDAVVHGGHLLGLVSAAVWQLLGDGVVARGIEAMKFNKPIKPDESFRIFVGEPEPIPQSRIGEHRMAVEILKDCDGRERVAAEGILTIILP